MSVSERCKASRAPHKTVTALMNAHRYGEIRPQKAASRSRSTHKADTRRAWTGNLVKCGDRIQARNRTRFTFEDALCSTRRAVRMETQAPCVRRNKTLRDLGSILINVDER